MAFRARNTDDRGEWSDSDRTYDARPRYSRRARRRSPSAESAVTYRRQDSEQSQAGNGTKSAIPKTIMAVGLVALAAALYHAWASKRNAEKESKLRNARRFEKAKARRRRDEERWEREQEEQDSFEESRTRPSRRIEYRPMTPRTRSPLQETRRMRTSSTHPDRHYPHDSRRSNDDRSPSPGV